MDNDLVTPVSLDLGTWHLAVDELGETRDTIWRDGLGGQCPEVLASLASLWNNVVPVVVDRVAAPFLWVAAWLALARNAGTGASWSRRADGARWVVAARGASSIRAGGRIASAIRAGGRISSAPCAGGRISSAPCAGGGIAWVWGGRRCRAGYCPNGRSRGRGV